jgi:hypothetical protein
MLGLLQSPPVSRIWHSSFCADKQAHLGNYEIQASYLCLLRKKCQAPKLLSDRNVNRLILRCMNCPNDSVMTLEKQKGLMYPFLADNSSLPKLPTMTFVYF